MANIVEFALKLKDLASSELGKFGAQAKRTFDNASRLTNDITGKNKILGSSYDVLQQKIRQVESVIRTSTIPSQIREARRELAALQRQSARHPGNMSGVGSTSGGLLGLAGLGKFAGPAALAGVGLAASVQKGMQNELQRTNITTLMGGNQSGADALFEKISEYAKNTVYDKAGIIDSQRTMMSYGLSSEFAFEKLKQIGDIAMGDKNRMQSLALAFSQATSTGKLMGQELLQMINAGFNPLNVISERTGESMTSLKERMSNGQLSAQELAKAFEWATEQGGLFYKGAEKAGETLSGKMNKMIDSLSEMAISIYGAIEPMLKPLVSFATTLFEIIGNGVEKLIKGFKEGNPIIMAVTTAISALTSGIALYKIITAVAAVAQSGFTIAVWASNFALLANPIVWITALVVGLVGGLVLLWKKSEGFRAAIYGMWEVMKGFGNILKEFVIDRIQGILTGLGAMGNAILKLFKGDFKGAWQSAKQGANSLIGFDAAANVYNSAKKLGGLYEQGVTKGRINFHKAKTKTSGSTAKTNTELLTDTAGTTAFNTATAAGTGSSMSNGGPKTITITIQKVLDNINIHATTFENGLDEVESKVLETMSRVLGQSVAQAL